MKEEENIFDKLRELTGKIQGNFNILEDQVDINLQMEYFHYSKEVKKNLDKDSALKDMEELFNEKKSVAEKKHLLSQLASIDDVKAYRAIEKYQQNPHQLLKAWSLLALQESKMLLESSLLDENQVFISTGLGGKGTKLRYFIVLFTSSGEEFNQLQQKIVKDEFEFELNRHNAEIEEVFFHDNFASILVLIPITATIHAIFKAAIDVCNEYGSFIKENFIITNVKKLSNEEITGFMKNNEIPGISDQNTIDTIDDEE